MATRSRSLNPQCELMNKPFSNKNNNNELVFKRTVKISVNRIENLHTLHVFTVYIFAVWEPEAEAVENHLLICFLKRLTELADLAALASSGRLFQRKAPLKEKRSRCVTRITKHQINENFTS